MTNLTEDEYTCLMILNEGGPLIYMKDTRWGPSLLSLADKGYAEIDHDLSRQTGNKNYRLTAMGRRALADREGSEEGMLRSMITQHGRINDARGAIHTLMTDARGKIVDAARKSSEVTGDSPTNCLRKILAELTLRCQEDLK